MSAKQATTTASPNDDLYATVGFSEKVDKALREVLPSQDLFDSPTFDPVAFINDAFPTESSLDQLDVFMHKLKRKAKIVDNDILTAVRKQTGQGSHAGKDLDEAKNAIVGLFNKIQDIKRKAEQSEAMVHQITKDIKALDNGKKNLTRSIQTLQKLHMLSMKNLFF